MSISREEEIRAELFEHTPTGHAPEVRALTEEALALGMDPMDILFKALIPSLEEVGRRIELGDFNADAVMAELDAANPRSRLMEPPT